MSIKSRHMLHAVWYVFLTSLWSVEGDHVTAGPITLLVENADSECVLGERFQTWDDGMIPLAREGQGLAHI